MSEYPIEGLMNTAMSSIKEMVDVNTIIGEPIETNISALLQEEVNSTVKVKKLIIKIKKKKVKMKNQECHLEEDLEQE